MYKKNYKNSPFIVNIFRNKINCIFITKQYKKMLNLINIRSIFKCIFKFIDFFSFSVLKTLNLGFL